jgi:hypothetical protein
VSESVAGRATIMEVPDVSSIRAPCSIAPGIFENLHLREEDTAMDDDRVANNFLHDFKSDMKAQTVSIGFRIPTHATMSKISMQYLLEVTRWQPGRPSELKYGLSRGNNLAHTKSIKI